MVKDLSTSYNENGTPMFTLTSYLVLVWRSLAKCNGSTIEETSVTFKNVSVIKNKNTPTSEDKLQVTLFPVSGDFEVCEDGGIVVTGNAKILEDAKEAKITLPYTSIKEAVLNTNDIYEELTKRGYTTDSHKCIKSSDINTKVGYITWVDWTSFIDALFQFDLLGKNTEAYLSPKHIETLNIDTKSHETICLQHRDLPVYNHRTMNVIVVGGVQICGIKWDIMHNDINGLEVKFQTLTFINGQLKTVDEIQKEVDHAHLEVSPGALASPRWVESPPLWPTPGREVCQVYYVGLNQRDLEIAYGKPMPEDQLGDVKNHQRHLGMEFSGRTSTGKRVMGIVQRGLATTVLADKRFLWDVPPNWSLSEAATVPVAFSTAYYALVIRGRIKAKQTVVVYNGANDIGLAAITLATHYGCKVYSTYGNGDESIFISSKFLEVPLSHVRQHWEPTFEKMILERSEGRGADLIINQLGADKIPTALGCLAAGGQLLNIGNEDFSRIDLSILKPNKSLHCVNMDSLSEDSWLEVAGLLSEGIRQGHVYPMQKSCFSKDVGHIREALGSLRALNGVGKTVIRIQQEEEDGQTLMLKSILASPRPHVNALHSYVLTGGPDEMVMELGQWLVSRGATKLVISRPDEYITGYLLWGIERWRQQGVKVLLTDIDTSSLEGAKKLLEKASALGVVGGVFDMTAVQEENNNFEAIETLDKVTRDAAGKLKYFVILSCLQQNHQKRDSLVRIVQSRKKSKLPGLVVDLGTIICPTQKADDYIASKYPSKNIRIAMKNLDNLLVQPYDMVTCAEI